MVRSARSMYIRYPIPVRMGEHGPTTVGLSGHKSIPLYEGSLEAHRFSYDVVYSK